jgi:non-ribosomal peptide synthetase component F
MYWHQQHLASFPALHLPFEQIPSEKARFEPASCAMTIAPDVAANIEVVAQKYDTTVAALLLACWQTLLWRLTDTADVVVGNVCDGREFEALHSACGLFAKSLPIHIDIEEATSFVTVLSQVHASLQNASEWQAYFTWDEHAGPAEGASAFLSFGFEYEDRLPTCDANGVRFAVYKQHSFLHRFRLHMSCADVNDAIAVMLHYDPACFEREHVQRIAEYFATLVQSAARHPETQASRLAVLSEHDQHHLLVALNNTAAVYPQDVAIHHLFEAQVELTPDAVAVVLEASALFLLTQSTAPDRVLDEVKAAGLHPPLIASNLTKEQEATLRSDFGTE